MRPKLDLTGQNYGRLHVLYLDTQNIKYRAWICKCSCGQQTTVIQTALRSGNTTSCGCYMKEVVTANGKQIKHGDSKHPLYKRLASMKDRCYNKKSSNYPGWGQRGIRICNEWLNDYLSFKKWALTNGWHPDLTIDRKNNNGDYTPQNCHWIPRGDQSKNRNKFPNKSSKYIGVCFIPSRNKWRSDIKINGVTQHLGYFVDEQKAAKIRDDYIVNNNLLFYKLNNI